MLTPRMTAYLVLAVAVAPAVAQAQASTGTAEYHFDVPGKRQYYSLYKNQIGIKFSKPQKASELVRSAESIEAKTGKKLVEVCKPTDPKQTTALKYVGPLGKSGKIAAYEISGCSTPGQLFWLSRELVNKFGSDIEAAGPLIQVFGRPDVHIMTDILKVDLNQCVWRAELGELSAFLTGLGLEMVGPDPIGPDRSFFLRLRHPKPPENPIDDPQSKLQTLSDYEDDLDNLPGASDALKDIGVECRELDRYRNQRRTGKPSTKPGRADVRLSGAAPLLVSISPSEVEAGFAAWLKAEKKKEDNFSTKITLNSTSNTAGETDDSKLAVDVKGTRGTYPGQLRMEVGAQVEFGDDEVEEDVTSILVNYDHYFEPWLESYAFVERFTNNFLSIEQRWEGGIGAMLQWDAKRHKTRDSFCANSGLTQFDYEIGEKETLLTKGARRNLEEFKNKVRGEMLSKGRVSKETAEEYCQYKRGIEKRHAKWQLGLAFSVIADFEQPDGLKVVATPTGDGMVVPDLDPLKVELTPDSSQVSRLTVRPSVTFRPNDKITLEGEYYFKRSLESDFDENGVEDIRQEWTVEGDLQLSESDPKVSLTASMTQYHDPRPPELEQAISISALGLTSSMENGLPLFVDVNGQRYSLSTLLAKETHTVVKFGVSISF